MVSTSNNLPEPCIEINVSFLSVRIWENAAVLHLMARLLLLLVLDLWMCVFETFQGCS